MRVRIVAGEVRRAARAGDTLAIPIARWAPAMYALRGVATLFSLGYYLYVVERVIPGDKALYGLPALLAGMALLVLHFIRHTPAAIVPAALPGRELLRDHSKRVQMHVAAHAVSIEEPPAHARFRLAEPGESYPALLGRLRADLARDDAYRGVSALLRQRLDQALRAPGAIAEERALALRVLADGSEAEVKRRIAEAGPDLAQEPEWLEAVALAENDAAALQRIERRVPRFEP
jgi:hypothetical protein